MAEVKLTQPDTIEFRGDRVKATFPKHLYIEIVKLQTENPGLSWDDICHLAAERLSANTKKFRDSVQRKVRSRERSSFMVALNKGRKTIEAKAREEGERVGVEKGKRAGAEEERLLGKAYFPCSACGGPLPLTKGSEWYKSVIRYLREAGWRHANCPAR